MSDSTGPTPGIANAINPRRLRVAREARGLTQSALARSIEGELSASAISQLENGRTRPTTATLRKLSEALDFPVEFFLRRDAQEDPQGFFRRLTSVPATDRRRALARAQMLHDLASTIERSVRLPALDVIREPSGPRLIGEIEELAGRLRRRWQLPSGPVANVVLELERHGIVVARYAMGRNDLDGFSVWYPDRPVVVLGDDKGVAARSRFDAAHELGHLVMHGHDRAGEREAEREANRFAAAFLMPEGDIRSELPAKADWRRLIDLKAQWGVSIGALLQRCRALDVMGEHVHLNAMKTMSARGWRTEEPGDELLGRPERPVLLERAIRLLEADGTDTIDDVADRAALSVTDVREILRYSMDQRPNVEL